MQPFRRLTCPINLARFQPVTIYRQPVVQVVQMLAWTFSPQPVRARYRPQAAVEKSH